MNKVLSFLFIVHRSSYETSFVALTLTKNSGFSYFESDSPVMKDYFPLTGTPIFYIVISMDLKRNMGSWASNYSHLIVRKYLKKMKKPLPYLRGRFSLTYYPFFRISNSSQSE